MFLILICLALAQALGLSHNPNIREIHRFPNGTWVENIAAHPSGNLLVTLVNTPELWEVVPSTGPGNSSAQLVHHFAQADSVNGIAELLPNVYAVIASNSVWKVVYMSNHENVPAPAHVAKLPAGTLNGMAALDDGARSVAISDSELGLVWRLDTHTGNYTVIHQDDTMAPTDDLDLQLGINGLRIGNGYLYYNNSPKRIFCRVRIDGSTGEALGPYEVVSRDVMADDFAIGPHGVGYLAGLIDNVVTRVFPNGTHNVIAGAHGSKELMTATSAAFGRTQSDYRTLYITTGGESEHPVDNTSTRGGKVMALSVDF